jgi:hypothetical protein
MEDLTMRCILDTCSNCGISLIHAAYPQIIMKWLMEPLLNESGRTEPETVILDLALNMIRNLLQGTKSQKVQKLSPSIIF